MQDKPEWLEQVLKAAQEAVRRAPLCFSSTHRGGENGLRNADEVVDAALHAFFDHVP